MSKRIAGKQMTQDNWNEEDEHEEPGVFKQASDAMMKERKVIKPRRKLGEGTGEAGSTGAFKGFGGFGSTNSGGTGMFSFGTGTTKPLAGLSNGSETKPSTEFKVTPFQVNKEETKSSGDKKGDNETEKPKAATNGVQKSDSANRSRYLHQLKCLNEGVTKWIKQHVDKNPYCILTPIFKDYEKHLADIEKHNPEKLQSTGNKESAEKKEEIKEETKPIVTTSESTMSSTFTFGTSAPKATSSSTTSSAGTSLFSFGTAKTATSTTGTSIFGGAAASGGATGFTFGTGSTGMKPFSFATGATGAASSSADNGSQDSAGGEDEEYVPPKVEVSEVKEEDSLYSKRCKMYYNREGTWIEKGVGNLHLKPLSGKTQLLIRADTNLGNILLNIMLNSQMPFARQGKNNVTFMCVPNPPLDPKDTGEPKPSSILLRVKTGEDADELLENINKHKGE